MNFFCNLKRELIFNKISFLCKTWIAYRKDTENEKENAPEEKDEKIVDDEEDIVFTFATRFGDDEDEDEDKNGIDLNVMKSLIG